MDLRIAGQRARHLPMMHLRRKRSPELIFVQALTRSGLSLLSFLRFGRALFHQRLGRLFPGLFFPIHSLAHRMAPVEDYLGARHSADAPDSEAIDQRRTVSMS